MEAIFRGENILEFIKSFPDDNKCREVIANEKWKNGYECKRCSNTKFIQFEKHFTRECTKCRYKESATCGTLFHKVKFGIQKAFCIVFEMSCTTKGLSSTQTAKRYGITQKTSWMFMQKVKLAMKSSENHPMKGNVQVDEFVVGGKETGKQGRSFDSVRDFEERKNRNEIWILIIFLIVSIYTYGQKFEDKKKQDTIYVLYKGGLNEERDLFYQAKHEFTERWYNFLIKDGKKIKNVILFFHYKIIRFENDGNHKLSDKKSISNKFIRKNKKRIIDLNFFEKHEICELRHGIINQLKVIYVIDMTERIGNKINMYEVSPSDICPYGE